MSERIGNGDKPNYTFEKTLPSGEVCTLAPSNKDWVVDMWTKEGENRWNRFYRNYEDAKKEYDRW